MRNKKKTAVEWLVNEVNKYLAWYVEGEPKAIPYNDGDLVRAMEQAKAMEREQIIEAIDYFNARPHTDITAEEYYNENYDIHTEKGEDYYNETYEQ